MTDRVAVKTRLGAFTVRRPTEAEALALAQKRLQVRQGQYPVDALDDGDEEILDCVVDPARDLVEAALDEAPRLAELLEKAVLELAGDQLDVLPDQLREGADPVDRELADLREKHGRVAAVTYGDTKLLITKIGRVEWKLFKRRTDTMKAMADLGRAHLVSGVIDPAQHPLLAAKLGAYLVRLAGGAVEAEAGK